MGREDLLPRIQTRARLHGPNETLRAVCAVAEALSGALPPSTFTIVAAGLPVAVRDGMTVHTEARVGCREFVSIIERRLHLDGPDAVFLARVVLEELNTAPREVTPAAVADLVAADLRPLLRARAAGMPEQPAVIRATIRRRPVASHAASGGGFRRVRETAG